MSFKGPRIWCLESYVLDAWSDYGVSGDKLRTWAYEEEDALISILYKHRPGAAFEHRRPVMPPPHHRFTGVFPV
jgi:hypothetical protein